MAISRILKLIFYGTNPLRESKSCSTKVRRSLSWSLEFDGDSGGVQSVAGGRRCALEFGAVTAVVFAVKPEVTDMELSNLAVTAAVVEMNPEVAVVELSNSTRDTLEYLPHLNSALLYLKRELALEHLSFTSVTGGRCRGALQFGSDGGSVRGEVGGGRRRGALEFGPSYLREDANFPKGLKQSDHLSIYLVAADSATLPSGWSRHACFNISVISQIPKFTVAQ
ncbi:hypothetical protein TIFTF001_051057, partial [Ficus carica]